MLLIGLLAILATMLIVHTWVWLGKIGAGRQAERIAGQLTGLTWRTGLDIAAVLLAGMGTVVLIYAIIHRRG